MSLKDCEYQEERRKLKRRIFCSVLAFIFLVLFVIFLIYVILRPSKPHFVLQDVTVLALNTSSAPGFLTTNVQVTVFSRNPNGRIGVYYENLDIFATYRSQQITLPALLPTTYQGHKDDLMTGMVLLNVKIDGRVKWKVGTWISGSYHIHVNCPAYISFCERKDCIGFGPTVKYQLVKSCTVDV
ncbi:NDR1/HIN1-like protein 1 [Vitis vinifera]|uniref:NDR1/HIN1-like protein 1 n=1 Tax=Vitis vinifera TaxID=29760 RepID=A0A438DCZ4_VITVI|nr:NDR1/HIN1-like protein 1 [Vitis vinifera]